MNSGAGALRGRALSLLAQREQSRSELRRKLERIAAAAGSEAGSPEIDALLDELAAQGYLSDERFIESRVHVRVGRFGVQRIKQELAQHGLKLSPQQQAELRDSEFERARAVWTRKFGGVPPAGTAERAKQMRFLTARGFAADVINRLIRQGRDD